MQGARRSAGSFTGLGGRPAVADQHHLSCQVLVLDDVRDLGLLAFLYIRQLHGFVVQRDLRLLGKFEGRRFLLLLIRTRCHDSPIQDDLLVLGLYGLDRAERYLGLWCVLFGGLTTLLFPFAPGLALRLPPTATREEPGEQDGSDEEERR